MSRLTEFEAITDAEEYFEFFDIEYNERLVYVKRFHIMKKFGEMIARAEGHDFGSEEKLLDYYKFSLLSVYKNFENGYNPSAADIWNMFDKPSACGSCSSSSACSDITEVTNGSHACTSQAGVILHEG